MIIHCFESYSHGLFWSCPSLAIETTTYKPNRLCGKLYYPWHRHHVEGTNSLPLSKDNGNKDERKCQRFEAVSAGFESDLRTASRVSTTEPPRQYHIQHQWRIQGVFWFPETPPGHFCLNRGWDPLLAPTFTSHLHLRLLETPLRPALDTPLNITTPMSCPLTFGDCFSPISSRHYVLLVITSGATFVVP